MVGTATAGRREGQTAAGRSSGALEGDAGAGEGLRNAASTRGSAAERRKPERPPQAPSKRRAEAAKGRHDRSHCGGWASSPWAGA